MTSVEVENLSNSHNSQSDALDMEKWRRKTAWPLGGAPWRCSKQLRGCQTSSGRPCRQVRKLLKTQVFSIIFDKAALQAKLKGFRYTWSFDNWTLFDILNFRLASFSVFDVFFHIHGNNDVMASSQALYSLTQMSIIFQSVPIRPMEARSRIKPVSNLLQSHQAANNLNSRLYCIKPVASFDSVHNNGFIASFWLFFVRFSTAAICCLRSFHSCSECSKLCWRGSRFSAWLALPRDERPTALWRRMLTCICEKHALRLYRTWVNKGKYVQDHVKFLFNAPWRLLWTLCNLVDVRSSG